MSSTNKAEELCHRLQMAVGQLAAVRGPIWSSYDSGEEIADFILSCLDDIKQETLPIEKKQELWGLFAPTCDWDDIVGDVESGEGIFQLLSELYWNDIHPRD